jgi:hypothetical protein
VEQTLIPFVPSALAGPVRYQRPTCLHPLTFSRDETILPCFNNPPPVTRIEHSPSSIVHLSFSLRHYHHAPFDRLSHCCQSSGASPSLRQPAQSPLLSRKQHTTLAFSSLDYTRLYTFACRIHYTNCLRYIIAAHSPARNSRSHHALTAPARSTTSVNTFTSPSH